MRWIVPSAIDMQMMPRQAPCSSMIRSSTKYSMKNWQLNPSERPNSVWSIACPVRSAAAAHRYACTVFCPLMSMPLPKFRLCPPNARW